MLFVSLSFRLTGRQRTDFRLVNPSANSVWRHKHTNTHTHLLHRTEYAFGLKQYRSDLVLVNFYWKINVRRVDTAAPEKCINK